MPGETNLNRLLKNMSPKLNSGDFIFYTTTERLTFDTHPPIMSFIEDEGITYILEKEIADTLNLSYEGIYNYITLKVHSSLEAVGLTAAVSKKLADNGISANVVAAFYHDHVFVPKDDANAAVSALKELTV